jgi:carboxylesterase
MRHRAGLPIFFGILALLIFGIFALRGIASRRPEAFDAVLPDDSPNCARVAAFVRGAVPDPDSYAARCLASGIAAASSLADPALPVDGARIARADATLQFAQALYAEGSAGFRIATAYRILARLYQKALDEGVTDRDDWPWLSIANGAPSARSAFLVHGFSATPRQLRRQADYLVSRGCNVFTMRLSCHGGSARLLDTGNYRAWLADGETAYRVASLIGDAVYGFGNSMGGAIVLHVAAAHPIAGVGVGAPALYLKNRLAETCALDALAVLSRLPLAGRWIPGVTFDDEYGYHTVPQPYGAILEERTLARAVRRELRAVSFPLFAAWNAGDDTIDADRCLAYLGSLPATAPVALREYPGQGYTLWDVPPRLAGGQESFKDKAARMGRYFRESAEFLLSTANQ